MSKLTKEELEEMELEQRKRMRRLDSMTNYIPYEMKEIYAMCDPDEYE